MKKKIGLLLMFVVACMGFMSCTKKNEVGFDLILNVRLQWSLVRLVLVQGAPSLNW